jgi:hypothetical protein
MNNIVKNIKGISFLNCTLSVKSFKDLERYILSMSNHPDKVLYVKCKPWNRHVFMQILSICDNISRKQRHEIIYRSGYLGIYQDKLDVSIDFRSVKILDIEYRYE